MLYPVLKDTSGKNTSKYIHTHTHSHTHSYKLRCFLQMFIHAFQIHVHMVEIAQGKYMDTNALARLDMKGPNAMKVCVVFLRSSIARFISLFNTTKATFGYIL